MQWPMASVQAASGFMIDAVQKKPLPLPERQQCRIITKNKGLASAVPVTVAKSQKNQ